MRTLILLCLAWFASAAPVFGSLGYGLDAVLNMVGYEPYFNPYDRPAEPHLLPPYEEVVPGTFTMPIPKPTPIRRPLLLDKSPGPPSQPLRTPQKPRTSDTPLAGSLSGPRSSSDRSRTSSVHVSGPDSGSHVRNPSTQPRPAPRPVAPPIRAHSRTDIRRYSPPLIFAPVDAETRGPIERFNIEMGDILLIDKLPGAPNPGQKHWTLVVGDIETEDTKQEGQANSREPQDFVSYICFLFNTDKKDMGKDWIKNDELFPKRNSMSVWDVDTWKEYYSHGYPLVPANVFMGKPWKIERNALVMYGAGLPSVARQIMDRMNVPYPYSMAIAYPPAYSHTYEHTVTAKKQTGK